MFIIKYIEDKSLFFVEIVEKINHKQIIEFLNIICETSVKDKNILIITDYRNAIIDERSIEPIQKIASFINLKMKKIFVTIKWANLSIDYLPTTGALLLQNLIKDNCIEYQPFTTYDGVLKWFNLSIDELDKLMVIKKENI